MHQLTKDPEWVLDRGRETGVLPPRTMNRFELSRYLDYCSEALSLTGKVAALYMRDFDDPVALQAVNEVEALTTGLSRKIWQKLSILYAMGERGLTGADEEALLRPEEVGDREGREQRPDPEGEAQAHVLGHPAHRDRARADPGVEGGQDPAEGRPAARGVDELAARGRRRPGTGCRSRGRTRRRPARAAAASGRGPWP